MLFRSTNNVILAALDYIDPAKGKILNAFGQDIDYALTADPAYYNAGTKSTNLEFHWGPNQVGQIWWNVGSLRYLDYEQDQLIYRMNTWGATFPGSTVQVAEWVESSVPPSQYSSVVGDGSALYADNSAYSTYGYTSQSGTINVKYYFWVVGKTSVAKGNSNSVYSITAAIQNPQSQGIPYATVLQDNTLALFNVNKFITGKNSIIHVESKNAQLLGTNHTEYTLIQENNPQSVMPLALQKKLIDSLAGQDSAGNTVPDPTLTAVQAYGISIRPRQSMFVNQNLARNNYFDYVNTVLLSYPVKENKLLTTLNKEEPIPPADAGVYNLVIDSTIELNYIDTNMLSEGYSVLVRSDSTQSGKWAIYTWSNPQISSWNLTRTQSYKTNLYWYTTDWYANGYNGSSQSNITVTNLLEFGKLDLTANQYIKVLNNGNNQFVVYYVNSDLSTTTVAIQNGTIQIRTDVTIPPTELRYLALAVQNDLFINDLAVNYNQLFFTMVKYALSEQANLDWVFKTSFLTATQYIRALKQFPAYIADNQNYYLDFINEVKSFRTNVRRFVVDYQGNDQYSGDTTDFDLPPYWDKTIQVYRSPSGEQSTDLNLISNIGAYNQWLNNHTYKVVNIVLENPGTGYISAPDIAIVGGNDTVSNAAKAYATMNGNGGIASIVVIDPGLNYTTTPTVVINGTGTGAKAYAILQAVFDGNNTGHNLVRSFNTTIKFDRINYTSANTFVQWAELTSANIGQTISPGTVIVNNQQLFLVGNTITIDSALDFPFGNVTQISSSIFDNANDRIIAYQGNIDLTLTQPGLQYPGVVVDGNTYNGNIYDTSISSFYANAFTNNTYEIDIDGGNYISTFASYAPEELVPGYMRDNLNLSVYDTSNIAYREFHTILGNAQFYRISSANTTTLTSDLHQNDSQIFVANAAVLPVPSLTNKTAGLVIINGEKIAYWRNYATELEIPWTANTVIPTSTLISYQSNLYVVTGNVYGSTFANVTVNVRPVQKNSLDQIRRGVDGTATPLVQPANSRIVDASVQQLMPNSYVVPYTLTSTTSFNTTGNISYQLNLSSNITANVGSYITQTFANSVVAANMRVLGNTVNNIVPMIYISGNVNTTLSNVIAVNGIVQTGAGAVSVSILGKVNAYGNATVIAGTQNPQILATSKIWANTASSLDSSTTQQATFLKNSPSYYATPGTTP